MPAALPEAPSPGSTLVGTRLLEEWIEAQTVGATASCALVAKACNVRGHHLVMQWRGKNAKRPAPHHWPVLLSVCGIDPAAWETWEKLGPDEPAAPPESGPREIVLPELGSTPDEIRASVRRALALLREKEITVKQRLDAEGRIQVGLSTLARLEERAALEDHPEFAAKIETILDALDATLRQFGIEPVGAREAWLAHVEALEKAPRRAA
jgi:hypothetical protein